MPENIQTVSIARETHERYLRYAVSVITSRALPDVRDGLKPVQRRILYTMFNDLRLHFDGRTMKSARIVGDVMGKYHPHGDSAIYDALVRMSQDWVMRLPLIIGQGNFGSVDGDPAAHFRYTEAKLAEIAGFLMRELRQETVEMRPNYNNETVEPVVLPAEFPNLLVNGASGIAVGMATSIPPHNPGEVIRSCLHLIDDKDATTAVLMDKGVKGPDFPLGGKIIADRATLRKIYEDGEGTIKVQAEWKLEKPDSKAPQIVITSIPYGTDKEKIENDIGTIIENRKLPGATATTNETNEKEGFRITIDLKPGTNPDMVMAYLYRHTDLATNFSFNMTCLVPSGDTVKPERLGLKEILRHFLDFRLATVKRRFEYELRVLKKRIHILEGFKIIFNALDKAIKLIRESNGKADANDKLIKAFGLDEEQANAILDSQLYKIAQLEIRKILDELKEKKAAAEEIEAILKSNRRLWSIVKSELTAIADKYTERRNTRMATDEDVLDFDPEDYIVRENTNVVLTRDGWIKRVGRLASVEGTRVREGDEVIAVVPASTHDHVVFFADDGTAYTMRVNEVPATSGHGEPISKFFKLDDQVRVIDAATTDLRFIDAETKPPTKEDPPGPYVFVATSAGYTARLPFATYREASTKAGRLYVRLRDGEKVVFAKVLAQHRWVEGKRTKIDEETIFLVSADGRVIHFRIDEVNILSAAGRGVIGIKLADDDTCIGGALVSGRFTKMDIETSGGQTRELGGGKPTVSRGGMGYSEVKRTQFTRIVPPPIDLTDWEAIELAAVGGKASGGKNGKHERNGKAGGGLFE